ncbi:unnamed protein product [Ascophyllum nodosum]
MEGRDFPRVATASLCSCSRGALLYFGHSSTSVNCDELVSAIKSVKAEDVKQGALAGSGHCWLVPAMACLAGTMPMAIHKIFVNKERSWRGKYRVRLYDVEKSAWTFITIDDDIPTRNGEPLFANPNGAALWAVLLEKAVAKFCGSYSAIAGGYEGWGLKTLTGNRVFTFRRLKPTEEGALGRWRRFDFLFKPSQGNERYPDSEGTDEFYESDKFWKILVNYARARKSAICVNIAGNGGDETRRDGLLESHAYSIVTALEYEGEKLIQIRNCWVRVPWLLLFSLDRTLLLTRMVLLVHYRTGPAPFHYFSYFRERLVLRMSLKRTRMASMPVHALPLTYVSRCARRTPAVSRETKLSGGSTSRGGENSFPLVSSPQPGLTTVLDWCPSC